jgi:hypothetical protein
MGVIVVQSTVFSAVIGGSHSTDVWCVFAEVARASQGSEREEKRCKTFEELHIDGRQIVSIRLSDISVSFFWLFYFQFL